MEITAVSEEQKREFIEKARAIFKDIRKMVDELDQDLDSTIIEHQTSAVWISGQLCNWYHDFVTQIHHVSQMKIKSELKEADNEPTLIKH